MIVLVVSVLACATAADAWVVPASEGRIALDASGDVLLGVTDFGAPLAKLRKLEGDTGRELWAADLPGVPHVDAGGDVFVSSGQGCTPVCATIAKLDGGSGAVLWQNDYTVGADIIDLAEGSVAGVFVRILGAGDETVLKLDGATGLPIWQRVFAGNAWTVGVGDADGDLIVGRPDESTGELEVSRLSEAAGATLWTTDVGEVFAAFPEIALDGTGDVLVVGPGTPDVAVKLSGSTGAVQWQVEPSFAPGVPIVVDANDDVFVGDGLAFSKLTGASGAESWSGSGTRFVVRPDGDVLALGPGGAFTRYDGTTGTVVWQQVMFGATVPLGTVRDMEIGARGVYATDPDFLVGLGARLTARKILVKDDTTNPTKSRLVVVSKDPLFHAPGQGAAAPTTNGASLTLANPTTLESAVFALPAARWTIKETGKLGRYVYKYADPTGTTPRCKAILASPGKVKVKCSGSLGGFTLDEPSQDDLQLTLSVGTGGHDYCMEFGGDAVQLDVGSLDSGRGIFKGRNASAASTCPDAF